MEDSAFLKADRRLDTELVDKLILQLNRIYPQILTDKEATRVSLCNTEQTYISITVAVKYSYLTAIPKMLLIIPLVRLLPRELPTKLRLSINKNISKEIMYMFLEYFALWINI